LLATLTSIASGASSPTVTPIPRIHGTYTVVRFRGHKDLLLRSIELYGIAGLRLSVSCDRCQRYDTKILHSHPASGVTLFQGVNWILQPGRRVTIHVDRAGQVGRYLILGARIGKTPELVFKSAGCLASLVRVESCPHGTPRPKAGAPVPQAAETTGSTANTWTNYLTAGGTGGPSLAANQTVQIACKVTGFKVADGDTWWYRIASSPWNGAYYVSADAFYNNGQTSGSLKGTPQVDPAIPTCETSSPGESGETTGSTANTWTNYVTAGGTAGPSLASNQTVRIACKVTGFKVADGDTWWYRIASSPWNGAYYVSADAFYNNGETYGSLQGTPQVDPAIPNCMTETTGSTANTWTNYVTAGGTAGPPLASNETVQIACKTIGFEVADGDTWWYRIASSPWNGAYYVSADAFYNNGQTSGSLQGTPQVDPTIPNC
jgi:hypothetical protein